MRLGRHKLRATEGERCAAREPPIVRSGQRTRPRAARYRPMARAIITVAEWLARADEARKLASSLPDTTARETMLGIAAGYEKLARYAALAAADDPDDRRRI